MNLAKLQLITIEYQIENLTALERQLKMPVELTSYSFEQAEEWALQKQTVNCIFLIEITKCPHEIWYFIEKMKAYSKLVQFMLLTPEKNFDIAFNALTYKIDQLLILPVTTEKLAAGILNCYAQLSKAEKIYADLQKLQGYELLRHQKMMEKILNSMLEKPEEVERLLWEINDRYDIHLGKENYQVILLNIDQPSLFLQGSTFVQKAMQLAEASFSNSMEAISAYVDHYGIVIILNLPKTFSREQYENNIQRLYQNIDAMQEEFSAYHLTLSIGHIVHSMKDISLSLEAAFSARLYSLTTEKKIIFSNHIPEQTQECILTESVMRNLYRYISMGDQVNVSKWFLKLRKELMEKEETAPQMYLKLQNGVSEYLQNLLKEQPDFFSSLEIWRWNYLFSAKELLSNIEETLSKVIAFRRKIEPDEREEPFAIAVSYMKQHLGEPLSLEEIASKFGLSSSYFSRMLKERMGQNYLEILTDFRMEKAKEYLVETTLPIFEVVEKIGYQDEKYFRKLFKQYTGMTPSEYRKKS